MFVAAVVGNYLAESENDVIAHIATAITLSFFLNSTHVISRQGCCEGSLIHSPGPPFSLMLPSQAIRRGGENGTIKHKDIIIKDNVIELAK